jgi:tetratricopeptide (TPR) repeat protein
MGVLVRVLLAVLLAVASVDGVGAQDLPPRLADRFSEGVTALKAAALDDAERAFRDVLAGGGDLAFVHHNLGIVLEQRGQHIDALTEFRAAARLDPSFGPARLLAGASLLALGRVHEATVQLQNAARLMPNEPAAHLQLADAYERSGNVAGLVDQYRRLVALAPANDEYTYRLGKAYLRLAQGSYERMRLIAPRTARLPQALAQQYLDQGQPDQALASLEEAARLGPTLPEIHLAQARIHLEAGRLDEAAAEVDRELAVAPDSRAARDLKNEIEAARKRP